MDLNKAPFEVDEIDPICSAMYRLKKPAGAWTLDQLERNVDQAEGQKTPLKNSNWRVEFDERSRRELSKEPREMQQLIFTDLRQRIPGSPDPRVYCSVASAEPALWRLQIEKSHLILHFLEHQSAYDF